MFFKNHSANDRLSIWRNLRQKEFNTSKDLVAEYENTKTFIPQIHRLYLKVGLILLK